MISDNTSMTAGQEDRNFDDLAETFAGRIYGSYKGRLREQLLWEQMQNHLPLGSTRLTVLDAGGGLGQMTERLAGLGHQVTLNDLSEVMLGKARQRLTAYTGVTYLHGPIQALADQSQAFDMIVCHALLEWLADPRDTLLKMLDCLKPGGHASLAFYNRHSLVYKNALMGNAFILQGRSLKQPRRKGLSPSNAQYPEDVQAWLEQSGYQLVAEYGVRCLTDWLPKATTETLSIEVLMEIERRFNQQMPYLRTGRYSHFLIQKS